MSRMINCLNCRLLAALFFSMVPLPCNADTRATLTEAQQRGGWKLIFDGKTTGGWRNYRQDEAGDGWRAEDGALVRRAANAGDIMTEEKYKYFELSLEYRISRGGNSGIMFHVTEEYDTPWKSGPEIQVQDNVHGHDPQKSGWLYQLYQPQKPEWATKFEQQVGFKGIEIDDATRPVGEWNHVYLRVSPLQSEVAVNGVSYYYFQKGSEDWNERVAKSKFAAYPNFGKADEGHICLQDHGNEVAYRNIMIRELSDDGSVPNPVDGYLPLKTVEAFPDLKWDGWEGISDDGRIKAQRPLVLTHAGDRSHRIFVASQIGMIHVFENDPGVNTSKMFLDLRDRVHDWEVDDEEGLLGLAFHPKYSENGYFYVYYSPESEPRVAYVSRFQVSDSDPDRADTGSEEIVMRIEQPFSNHNGGSIAFGPDGYLYIGLGDGGGRNDPMAMGQDPKTWMGCVLRIDVDSKAAGKKYGIPQDNPFANHKSIQPEVFAYGFRNVWRLAFDRETGHLWCGDVGQDLWEEINVIRSGGNYGWSVREGTQAFGNGEPGPHGWIDPIWEYDHQVGKSITGGFVYRGQKLPILHGSYLYGDYISGRVWALKYDESGGRVIQNMGIKTSGVPVFSFGEDEEGEVYYLVSAPTGRTIFKFVTSE